MYESKRQYQYGTGRRKSSVARVRLYQGGTGSIIINDTDTLAGSMGFEVTLEGQGGHGSRPEKCIDPINTGVHVYLALQELIARECPAISETALTIGQFCAGSASNVIPETAVLQGTMRSFDEKTMSHLIARLNEIVPSVAGAYRTKAEIEVISDIPIVRCNEELNQEIVEGLK